LLFYKQAKHADEDAADLAQRQQDPSHYHGGDEDRCIQYQLR
jgi:hypothetical protein